MNRFLIVLFVFLSSLSWGWGDGKVGTVFIINNVQSKLAPELNSPRSLLGSAVAAGCNICSVEILNLDMTKKREFSGRYAGEVTPNVFVGGFSSERSASMLLIPFNIDEGLVGVRSLIVKKNDLAAFRYINSVEDLRGIRVGQVDGWPDASILEFNGINVVRAPNVSSLFKMLSADRFDAVLWSAAEAIANADYLEQNGLVVNNKLKVCYPSGKFFYVESKDFARYEIILDGLAKLRRSGYLKSFNSPVRKRIDGFFDVNVKKIRFESNQNYKLLKSPC